MTAQHPQYTTPQPAAQSEEQHEYPQAFFRAFDLLEKEGRNVFVTGKAGSGKSTFLQYFRSRSRRNVVVLAPTGVAALHVRGQTIHSFFRFAPHFLDSQSITEVKRNRKLYKSIDVLVIDEISMVRADVFDAMERFLRINGRCPGQPFGGVQLCVVGDLYQLPPVVSYAETEIFRQFYATPFFFSANAYTAADFATVEFTEIYRQSEPDFIAMLNRVRSGDSSEQVVSFLNQRFQPLSMPQEGDFPVILTSTNRHADTLNRHNLDALSGQEFCYRGIRTGTFELSGDKLPAPEELRLKEGAQVMFTRNDMKKRWVNGTVGKIAALSEHSITVRVKKHGQEQHYVLERESWDTVKYHVDADVGKVFTEVTGSYEQYPLMPAWAITIHKSQGKTLEHVVIDLGASGAFAAGQLYVALSRCRTFRHIVLKEKVQARDIRCNPAVTRFMQQEVVKEEI